MMAFSHISAFPGRNFESKLFHELCQLVGTTKSHTTAFHPSCDGQAERQVRSLVQMLKTTADENPATWPQRLPTLMAAYRMTTHKTTGITPNMAMLGREVMLPAAVIARPPEEPTRTSVPFVRDLREALRDAHEKVRKTTKATARTQKIIMMKNLNKVQQGQLVWLYWPRPPDRQKFKKLQKLWTGPWKIERFKTPLVVLLKHTLKNTRQTVHVDRLLPCNTPPSETEAGTPPDTDSPTDRQRVPDSNTQFSPDANQDSQSREESQSASESQRPVRWRLRPAALEPYILG